MGFKKGDKLRCVDNRERDGVPVSLTLGKIYIAQNDVGSGGVHIIPDNLTPTNFLTYRFEKVEDSIFENVKEVIYKNKTIIYIVFALCIVDHLFLSGQFRKKLQEIFGKLIDKLSNRGAP